MSRAATAIWINFLGERCPASIAIVALFSQVRYEHLVEGASSASLCGELSRDAVQTVRIVLLA
jgi:hypothetical protein